MIACLQPKLLDMLEKAKPPKARQSHGIYAKLTADLAGTETKRHAEQSHLFWSSQSNLRLCIFL
jgi:hypothetical protein